MAGGGLAAELAIADCRLALAHSNVIECDGRKKRGLWSFVCMLFFTPQGEK